MDASEMSVSASIPSLRREDDPSGANGYSPENLLDGNPRTAWVEGVAGLGIDARLRFVFPQRAALAKIQIVDGYAKTETTALDNAAARKVRIYTDAARPLSWTLARSSRPQTISGPFGTTRHVTIEIASAWKGDRFKDLAISEVIFFAPSS